MGPRFGEWPAGRRWTVLTEIEQALVSVAYIGNGSGWYPPRDARGFLAVLKPFSSSAQISDVPALVDEMLQ